MTDTTGPLLATACQRFEDMVSHTRSALERAPRSAGDLAIVGYTSGTTGLPEGKGAVVAEAKPLAGRGAE